MKYTVLFISLLILGVLYFSSAFKINDLGNPKETDFNYNFSLKDVSGKTISMQQYKGKVIFLNLWATWCGPCRYEMPGIQKLYSNVGSKDVVFVMLSIDREGEQRKVEAYVKSNAYTFPVFMPSGSLPDQLNVPSIPTTFIIDKKGKIVQRQVGTTNYDSEKYVKLLTDLSKQ